MKILYGIQGTGHGHISRARALLPILQAHARVDVLMSGHAAKLSINGPVVFHKRGLSLVYDSQGGVDALETLKACRLIQFWRDVHSIPVARYDMVISDYEPVTAWAAKLRGVPSHALSHQAAFLCGKTPRPAQKSAVAEQLLRYFAPTDTATGFHFRQYGPLVEPPLIRQKIQWLEPTNGGPICVYLPAFAPGWLASFFNAFGGHQWQVFSPDCKQAFRQQNVWVEPLSTHRFLQCLERSRGVVTGAGFEMCSEAMFLNKKLLVVPIAGQYEQLSNAAALQKLGVTVLHTLSGAEREVQAWLKNGQTVPLPAVANPEAIVGRLLEHKGSAKRHLA